jgi:hypothetical protein
MANKHIPLARESMLLKNNYIMDNVSEVSIIQEERSGHFHLWLLPRYKWMNEKFENSIQVHGLNIASMLQRQQD